MVQQHAKMMGLDEVSMGGPNRKLTERSQRFEEDQNLLRMFKLNFK